MNGLVLKDGDTFFVAGPDGMARPHPGCPPREAPPAAAGLYRRDTQFLSAYAWRAAGRALECREMRPAAVAPEPDPGAVREPWRAGFHARRPGGPVAVTRRLVIGQGNLQEEVTVACDGEREVAFPLSLQVGTRFRDVFEVRGWVRGRRGRDRKPRTAGGRGPPGTCGSHRPGRSRSG